MTSETQQQCDGQSMTQPGARRDSTLKTLLLCLAFVLAILISYGVGLRRGANFVAGVGRQSFDAALQLSGINMALEMFYADAGRFPTPTEGLAILKEPKFRGPYITQDVSLIDPWGRPYVYDCDGSDSDVPMLRCYGADGKPGGCNEDGDVMIRPMGHLENFRKTLPASDLSGTQTPMETP